MNRRSFLKNGSVTGIAITSIGLASCQQTTNEVKDVNDKAGDQFIDDFELKEATIDELQQKMQNGTHTAKSLTELYLKRIEAIDRKGPTLNSVIEINPDAISIAEGMDRERKEGKFRGPMHGIPVLIKDNIDTGDKMMTTAGSLALDGT